jgi:phenylpyruvate tautomerase PptA (4-oxalocrotonate tautomerase family)
MSVAANSSAACAARPPPCNNSASRRRHDRKTAESAESDYVRVQVLTNANALDRDKQLNVVSRFTELVAEAAGDPTLTERTWVLLTQAVPGGWGLGGHAHTNDELVAAARAQITELQSGEAKE